MYIPILKAAFLAMIREHFQIGVTYWGNGTWQKWFGIVSCYNRL